MLRRVPLNLRRSLRNLHTHASYYKRSGFTVETVLATAVVAGSILWYSTNTRIHNDALPFSEKQQKLSSPSLAKLAEHGALTTVVWGSNRQAYSSRYSDYFFFDQKDMPGQAWCPQRAHHTKSMVQPFCGGLTTLLYMTWLSTRTTLHVLTREGTYTTAVGTPHLNRGNRQS